MTTDNKTLADVQPGGRVRLGDRPKDGEVLVEVSGLTGSGKSAIAGEIEILCKALGLEVEWVNGDEEKRLTHADWIGALEMYKPKVVIVEQNIPRAALSAQPSPGGHGGYVQGCDELRARADGERAAYLEGLEEGKKVAARQPVGEPVDFFVCDACGHYYMEDGVTCDCTPDAVQPPLRHVRMAVYPAAQAVDLDAVREALQAAEGLATVCASVDGYSREEVAASGRAMRQQFADALAKVDSQVVGNG